MNVVTISIMLVLCIANANAQTGIYCFKGDGTGDAEECFDGFYENSKGKMIPQDAKYTSCHKVRS